MGLDYYRLGEVEKQTFSSFWVPYCWGAGEAHGEGKRQKSTGDERNDLTSAPEQFAELLPLTAERSGPGRLEIHLSFQNWNKVLVLPWQQKK